MAPVAAAVLACADSTSDPGPSSGVDASTGSDSDTPGDDAGRRSTCEITRAYFEGCGNDSDLNCGTEKFDSWCAQNDQAINSEAYRRAEELCLTSDHCDGADRRDCEYRHYNDETLTAAQEALVTAYCETCEPSDVSGCTKRSTTYDPAKGINSVGDIFIAAWEFGDTIALEMRTTCTGSGVDAGVDTTACAETFAGCTADVYLARLPDCPK
ncbi:MAG: hypothetical protein K0S65_798 [Labilithrix sp.]|nr:hypothetical protein [Labilithrix sp.]